MGKKEKPIRICSATNIRFEDGDNKVIVLKEGYVYENQNYNIPVTPYFLNKYHLPENYKSKTICGKNETELLKSVKNKKDKEIIKEIMKRGTI